MRQWTADPGGRFGALSLPSYRRYLLGSVASVGAFQLLIMGQGWLVYELSGSSLQLGVPRRGRLDPHHRRHSRRRGRRRPGGPAPVAHRHLRDHRCSPRPARGPRRERDGRGLARARHRRRDRPHHRLRLPYPAGVLPAPHPARAHDERSRPQLHALAGHPDVPPRLRRCHHRVHRHLGRVRGRRDGFPSPCPG